MPVWPIFLTAIYCLLVVGGSLTGGWLPRWVRFTHTRMQAMMSFVGGVMLGVAVLHLWPHAARQTSPYEAGVAVLMGLIVMFLLIRVFHAHHHVVPAPKNQGDKGSAPAHHHEGHHDHAAPGHDHSGAAHDCGNASVSCHVHQFSWFGLFVGLALHTLIDGIALAASVTGGSVLQPKGWLLGLGTFVSILLHKPLDALSITSVMIAAGWQRTWISVVNLAFALMCPLGAMVFLFGIQHLGNQPATVGLALGFAAGVFLCIALGDILPEVQFHQHDRVLLTTALLLGVIVAFGVGWLERLRLTTLELGP